MSKRKQVSSHFRYSLYCSCCCCCCSYSCSWKYKTKQTFSVGFILLIKNSIKYSDPSLIDFNAEIFRSIDDFSKEILRIQNEKIFLTRVIVIIRFTINKILPKNVGVFVILMEKEEKRTRLIHATWCIYN